jgi:tetratricopeptide (TPR) repeat protein
MKNLFILLLTGALAGLSACKGTQKAVSDASSEQTNETTKQAKEDLRFEHAFFTAEKEKITGNYEAAGSAYAQCIKLDSSKPTPFYQLAIIYISLGKNAQALELSQRAYELDPNNFWFGYLYADLLSKNQKHEAAAKMYERLVKKNPGNPDLFIEWANAYIMAGKTSDAMKVYDQMEKTLGVTEDISLQKQKIHLAQGNIDKAIGETKKLSEAYPREPRYLGMLAELYQQKGMDEKASEVLGKIFEIDPGNPHAHLSLSDYHNKKGNYVKAFQHLETAFSSPELDIDTKMRVLLSYYVITERKPDLKEDAYKLTNTLIKVHPTEAKPYAMMGDFLVRDQKFSEARDNFRKAVELDKDKFVIWNQLLLLESELNDYEGMDKGSAEALEFFPGQPSLYLFAGIANYHKGNLEKAIEMLEAGVVLVADNKPLKGQFYSSLGDAYNKTGEHSNSDKSYEKALEQEPDNMFVLNNYSYYLSLRNEKLEKAASMSKRANELLPNNASFLDTYAWILFKQGKYQEAKNWMEKALSNGGSGSPVVLEHYGDILFKLGDTAGALEHWKKAVNAGGTSQVLEQKIKEKKLTEK